MCWCGAPELPWAVRPGPFARSKAAIWLQLSLVCALLACPTSHTDAREDLIEYVKGGEDVDHASRLYWIQDSVDGLCVGEAGMGPCGDANLWGVRQEAEGYSLELLGARQLTATWPEAEGHVCLATKHCHKGSSPVEVAPCTHCGARDWTLDGHGRIAHDRGTRCLARSGREVYMAVCAYLPRNGTGTFRLVEYRPFHFEPQQQQQAMVVDGGSATASGEGVGAEDGPHDLIKDERTGLVFPQDMSLQLGEEHGRRQVYMGGGAFKFAFIDIYQVALYIDAAKAAHSPVLHAYAGLTREQLVANESFYAAMMSLDDPVKYDRSIYVKLLIPLNAATVKKSLEAEWNMTPANKKLLLDTSFRHAAAARCCNRGTELLFTWTAEGVLEVRLNDRLVEVFASDVLAQDLFYQYVCDDPISPHAKKGFVDRYPELLSPSSPSTSSSASTSHTGAPLHVKHSGSSSSSRHTQSTASVSSPHADSNTRSPVSSPSSFSAPHHQPTTMDTPPRKPSFAERNRSFDRWVAAVLSAYVILLLFSLPNCRRGLQERLQRGGGSLRARALQVGKMEVRQYMTRVASSGGMDALVKAAMAAR